MIKPRADQRGEASAYALLEDRSAARKMGDSGRIGTKRQSCLPFGSFQDRLGTSVGSRPSGETQLSRRVTMRSNRTWSILPTLQITRRLGHHTCSSYPSVDGDGITCS